MSRGFLTFNDELEVPKAIDVLSSTLTSTDSDKPDPEIRTETRSPLPLQDTWDIWEQIENENPQQDYTDNMKPISSFSTVQDFWELWHVLPQPSQLMRDKRMVRGGEDERPQMVDAIMIFKQDVKPMWEDPKNASGGHFEIRYLQTRNLDEQAQLDEHWNNLALGVVGATIDPAEMITGIRLVDKLHSSGRSGGFIRIEIWYTDLKIPDGVALLRSNIEKALSTKLDGTRSIGKISMVQKNHFRK